MFRTLLLISYSCLRNEEATLFLGPSPSPPLELELVGAGAHQMEPPSPIQALGVNPFPSRFIIRTVPRGDFARRRWEEPITTTK